MAIPIFFTQIVPASTDYVQAPAGSVQAIPLTAYYYLITGKTSSGNGQSFLSLLGSLLTTSSGGAVTWTVTLTAAFKVKFTHNNGSTQNATIDAGLGFELGGSNGYAPGTPASLSVPAGAGGTTLPYVPVWLWTPEQNVSDVGPALFDPATSAGIKKSNGSAARAPDGTASYVDNGELVDATFIFTAVERYYKAHPSETETVHRNEDFETFWEWGARKGRRIIFWKNRAQVVGVSSFLSGQQDYYEYNPSDAFHAAPSIVPAAPPNLYLWNITVPLWLTERGAGGTAIYT